MRDGLRYAIVFDEAGFTDKVLQALQQLRQQFDLERLRNTFTEDAVYKGINVTLRDKESGAPFEIQFHTEASMRAKGDTHNLYRQSLNPHLNRQERAQVLRKMQEISSKAKVPDGVACIAEEAERPRTADGGAPVAGPARGGAGLGQAWRAQLSQQHGAQPRPQGKPGEQQPSRTSP